MLAVQGLHALDNKSADEDAAAARLLAVRDAERVLASERDSKLGERKSLIAALRDSELQVAASSRQIVALDQQIGARQTELNLLDRRHTELDARLEGERLAMAALLRSVYFVGRDAPLKLLLAPDRMNDAARVLAYQRYLERDRLARIGAFKRDLAQLAEVEKQTREATAVLSADKSQREKQRSDLESARLARGVALAALEQTLTEQGERLAALARDEKSLLELLERLRDAIADIPKLLAGAEPLSSLRGKLPWPLAGAVAARFGAAGIDGHSSSGWLIGAHSGAPVSAVARGRIAYADWLKGYGLIAIVDHGDGYMTLYAHAESLLKDVGEWVEAGETIASAGSSGGVAESGVYFELRHKGEPQDPAGWLVKK